VAHWYGVIALERRQMEPLQRTLSRDASEALAAGLMAQAARYVPAQALGLGWAAALYDPAQLLRRGFPVHREILDLAHAGRAQGIDIGRVLTLAAIDEAMPTAVLQPEIALGAGTLQVIPWLLWGEDKTIAEATQRLESELFDQGLADPAIALALGELGAAFEHARLMSISDLMAMMAAQLDHVGLSAAWLLIEELLLAEIPRPLAVRSRLDQHWRLDGDKAILPFEPLSAYAVRVPVDHPEPMLGDYLERVHEFRQTQALLRAHDIDVGVEPAPEAGFIVDRKSDGDLHSAVLHEHPGLGALAFTTLDAHANVLAHYYPVTPDAIRDFLARLRERGVPLQRPGRVQLRADGFDLGA